MKGISLNVERSKETLERLWSEVSKLPKERLYEVTFVEDRNIVDCIKDIVRGRNKSYKYALVTQVLAKMSNPLVNALALQKKAQIQGSFDARSFCRKVVVEFEKAHFRGIIGGAEDPYVSKPLRHPMISLDEQIFSHIRDKEGWKKLYYVLKAVQEKNDKSFTENVLKQILLEIRKIKEELETEIPMEAILSDIPAHKLKQAVDMFLKTPSEGARAQSLVYALMRVLNKKVNVFGKIESSRSTVADTYARKMADIECFGKDGSIKVGISVTESLDSRKLREELDKAIERRLSKLIIIAHKIKSDENFRKVLDTYKDKVDFVVNDLNSFILTLTTLLNEKMRREFLVEVARVLEELGYLEHLEAWHKTLSTLFK